MAIPPQLLMQLLPMLMQMGRRQGSGQSPFSQGMMQGLLPMAAQGSFGGSGVPAPLKMGALGGLAGLGK